jgi:hypothetical protein
MQFKFQETFRTPKDDQHRFVRAILSALEPSEAVIRTIDEIVFEPVRLNTLLARLGIPALRMGNTSSMHDCSIELWGQEDVQNVLECALADAVNFAFVPRPRRFMIYSDHDEYTTFFAATKSNLKGVCGALSQQGFGRQEYSRRL